MFVALSLNEFKFCFDDMLGVNEKDIDEPIYVCIDIANGHMKKLVDMCKRAKEKYGDKLVIMAGNIANPETYYKYAEAGIDYVRRCASGTARRPRGCR